MLSTFNHVLLQKKKELAGIISHAFYNKISNVKLRRNIKMYNYVNVQITYIIIKFKSLS